MGAEDEAGDEVAEHHRLAELVEHDVGHRGENVDEDQLLKEVRSGQRNIYSSW